MSEEHYYYAVARGRNPAIYYVKSSKYREVVKPQVDLFSDNRFKRFNDKNDAVIFMRRNEVHNTIQIYDYRLRVLETIDDDAGSDNCFICGVYVDSDEPHPQCDICKSWFHLACVNMTREDAPGGDDDWSCHECFDARPNQNRGHDPAIGLTSTVLTNDQSSVPAVILNAEASAIDRLISRMDGLESENAALKLRIEKLENQLKSKDEKGIINGLKVVTDASIITMKKLEVKEEQIKQIRNEVKKIKDNAKSQTLGVAREEALPNGRAPSWAEVVGKGGGIKSSKGRANPKRGRVNKGKKGRDLRVEMFADSHGRGISNLLTGVDVTFKPGARMERVVEGAGRERTSCTIIMGGTNDVSVDGIKKGMLKLREGLGRNRRVVIVGVPHRYDEPYPNVDKMIERKNVFLKDFCILHGYKFLNIDDGERHLFTRHGLHFNLTGKRWLANRIKTAVDFL